jgi:6-phosphogluconate dehydrogenase
MHIGIVGLGKMGTGMRARLREHGHHVTGFDIVNDDRDVDSLDDLVDALADEPRRWCGSWSRRASPPTTRSTCWPRC